MSDFVLAFLSCFSFFGVGVGCCIAVLIICLSAGYEKQNDRMRRMAQPFGFAGFFETVFFFIVAWLLVCLFPERRRRFPRVPVLSLTHSLLGSKDEAILNYSFF
eukprot:RCo014488